MKNVGLNRFVQAMGSDVMGNEDEKQIRVSKNRKYKNAEEMKVVIDDYFNMCNDNRRPYTVSGLARHLGLTRKTLLEYQNKYEGEYAELIEDAKTRIEEFVESCLFKNGIATGTIFNLKNNFGWNDKQEVEHSGDVNVKLEDLI